MAREYWREVDPKMGRCQPQEPEVKRMKKSKINQPIRLVALTVVVLVIMTACGSGSASNNANGSTPSNKGGQFVIGTVNGLTGQYSSIGNTELNALKVGIKQVNADGGIMGKKVVLVSRDDGSDPAQELLAVQDLVSNVKPDLLCPDPISSLALASLPFTSAQKILTMGNGSSPALGDPKNYPYNFTFGDLSSERAIAVVQAVLNTKQTKVGVLYQAASAQTTFAQSFSQLAPTVGLTVVNSVSVGSTTDMTPELAQIRQSGANVLVFDDQAVGQLTVAMTGLQTLGWKVPVYVTPDVVNGDMSKLVPDSVKSQFHAVDLLISTTAAESRPAVKAWVNAMVKLGPLLQRPNAGQTDIVWVAKWAYETSQKKYGNVSASSVTKVLETIGNKNAFPYADKMVEWNPNPAFSAESHNTAAFDYSNFWAIHGATTPVNGGYPDATPFKITIK
jgi:ABC-type branched-subunit amino acid transport system substrate-binding protein